MSGNVQVQCPNGHYFDLREDGVCPSCGGSASAKETVFAPESGPSGVGPSPPQRPIASTRLQEGEQAEAPQRPAVAADRPGRAPSHRGPATVLDDRLLVGWLVCYEGPGRGKDYRLYSGANPIGRDPGPEGKIVLSDDDRISRDVQAVVIYDVADGAYEIKQRGSSNPTYVNGHVADPGFKLRSHDRIRMGRTHLLFVPLIDERFTWPRRGPAQE